jgi:AcrR family transcriptional regulator
MARRDSKVKQHILATTVAMITESGPVKVHVADVARRASVGIPTIYYHFDSRAKLIAEAQLVRYEETIRPVRELMDEIEVALGDENDDDFWEAVDRYVALVWTPSQVHGKYEVGTLLLDDALDSDVRDELFAAMNHQYRRWVDVVAAAQARGWFTPRVDGEALTSLFWSASVGQFLATNSAYKTLTPEMMVGLFRDIVRA